MNVTEKLEIYKCRTCYDAKNGLKPLKDLTKCGVNENQEKKPFGQLLNEISSINVMDDLNKELPQYICDGCICKLKMAHAFVQQAQDVNTRLMTMVLNQTEAYKEPDCLRETEIDVPPCLGIKMDPVEEESQDISGEESVIEIKQEEMEVDKSTNIFEQYQSQDESSLLAIPKSIYNFSRDDRELPSQPEIPKNEDILGIFKSLTTRLEYIESNQSALSHGQATVVANQKVIVKKLEQIEAHIVSKAAMVTLSAKKLGESVCRTTDVKRDEQIEQIANLLPLKTVAEVLKVEQMLENPDFSQAMTTYLHKLKGISEDVGSVIRSVMTDDLLDTYNWEGRWEKNSLGKLFLFSRTLRDVFQKQGSFDFERSIRKAVERSHHRLKQKKYLKKSK